MIDRPLLESIGCVMDISSINLLRINLIYGTVCEQCSKESCPTMSGGAKFEYLWQVGFSPFSLVVNAHI